MYFTFLRPKEIRFLKVGDVDVIGQKIRVVGEVAKNRKTAYVDMPQQLTTLFKNSGRLQARTNPCGI